PPAGAQWIYVADREADFYEPLQICREQGMDFVIRARTDRRLADEGGHLHQTLGQAPLLQETKVELGARPGQAARTARVQLRSVRVDLDGPWRPGGWQDPLREVGVVEVREVGAPAGVEPLHWILLTSLPGQTVAQVERVVGRYHARWWIEEYHKALKSGAGVEQSQLAEAGRLQALVAVLAVVAVRLLSTKLLARSRPDTFEAAESFGPEMLTLLEQKIGPPVGGWTNAKLMVSVARLGGFIGRRSDGMPGWQTIWRGWQRLIWMLEGATLTRG
ncbi:MAG: IS4 family transposase, partial [Anaerolineales bacterium]